MRTQLVVSSTARRTAARSGSEIGTLLAMTKRLVDAADDPPAAKQRLSGPGELLQAVPYLLGFHPARSLVLVGLRDGLLVVTARLDLPEHDLAAGAGDRTLADTLASMCAGGTTELIAAIYGDGDRPPRGALPWGGLVDLLDELAEARALHLQDVLLVSGGRWWSYGCDSDECCPSEGQPLPVAPSAFAARSTVAGVVPLPDRDAVAALLAPLPDAERQALRPLLAEAGNDRGAARPDAARHERSVKRALFAAARASTQARWTPPTDAEVARLATALASIPVRDAVWLAIDSRRLDGRPLWRDLARRVPAPYDAAPLFLYGWASWRAGDGALARIAADRAVAGTPGYSAADLLLAALSQGIDPRRFPKLRRTA